ncbi:MAG TPA: glycoside hydrolase family 2 protein [Bacteroidales bacterium]|nr:glycoside hydrolase family 2 protein [Bacteroidales bacterium]
MGGRFKDLMIKKMKTKSFIGILFLSLFIFNSCKKTSVPSHEMRLLTSDSLKWVVTYNGKNYPATVPGTIHNDLKDNGIIEDPFYRNNENSVQWVSNKVWIYTAIFDKGSIGLYENGALVFDGLDTYAEVFLNGEQLKAEDGTKQTNNMFRQWRFPLPKNLKETHNVLTVKFSPSVPKEVAAAQKIPYKLPDNRVFSRKAPYQTGWDWGPKLITCGIWQKVYLDLWNGFKIDNIHLKQTELTKRKGVVEVASTIYASKSEKVDLNFYVDGSKIGSKSVSLKAGKNVIKEPVKVRNPEYWWPAGMGSHKLYTVKVEVENDRYFTSKEDKFGFRTIELRKVKDKIGESFEFIVNGVPVFMKGANWIPVHSFPTEKENNQRYKDLLLSAKEANMNMIRVWGGGIYENDRFYELCDELGLLVWQDFIFACALYPGDQAFIHNVTKEAEYQIQRLRNHPSLALWCGNNEVKNGWDDWGWKDAYSLDVQKELDFNLKNLFNQLLPNLVAQNDNRPYHPSSPEWGWGHPECLTHGDSHYWGVWWGEEPFEVWGPKTGRFMSEYGFQAYPEISTIEKFTLPSDRNLNSIVMRNHQKHPRGVQIIKKAMQQYAFIPDSLQDFVYVSQLVQAYGIGEAIEKHRMKNPHCMGTLYWQLNDCWPVASWSSIDYYGNWKALHYKVKEKFEPTIIATDKKDLQTYDIYIVTDLLKKQTGELFIEEMNYSGQILHQEKHSVEVKPNSSTLVFTYHSNPDLSDSKLLKISFKDKKGKVIAQKLMIYDMRFIPNEAKNFKYEVIKKGNKYEITFTTDYFIRGVMISTNPSVKGKYSDNYFDLFSGEKKKVIFTPTKSGTKAIQFKVKTYNEVGGKVFLLE